MLAVFESGAEAARETGCIGSKITAVCKGKRKSTGGFSWRYVA